MSSYSGGRIQAIDALRGFCVVLMCFHHFFYDLAAFLEGDRNTQIIIDPSAASFKAELRRRGFRVLDAKNDVREGLATTAVLIGSRRVRAERSRCPALLREIHSYVWDDKARRKGEERPVKDHDHAMDALRYLCHTRATRFRR